MPPKSRISSSSPSQIRSHVEMLHQIADGLKGVLVVSTFYASPTGQQDVKGAITKHDVGDIDGMVGAVEAAASVDNANVYIGLQVMQPGLGRGQRGTESDILAVLGLVADMDADTGKSGYVPFPPSYVIETSPGNKQPAWLFDRPLSPAEAKPLAAALRRATQSDAGTSDITHVWRVPGTRNWPNAKKLARGRASDPFDVRYDEEWGGDLVDVDAFRAALEPWMREPANDNHFTLGEAVDVGSIQVSANIAEMLASDGQPDRSAHAARLVEAMSFEAHTAEEALSLFMAADGEWAERYKSSDARQKDFERLWGKFSGKHAEPRDKHLAGRLLSSQAAIGHAANDNEPAKAGPAFPIITEWTASRFVGDPPPVEYLVDGAIESGVPGMVAAMGELGKSYLLLELCRRVAFGGGKMMPPIFGGQVSQEGSAVFLTGEDDARTMHRRVAEIDPKNQRFAEKGDKLITIPMPSAMSGGAAFWVESKGEYRATDAWRSFVDQLMGIGDLRVVVVDPLQVFAALPINEDPAAGQFVCSQLAGLCATTGANAFFAHHMKKPGRDGRIATLSDARDSIRGTSALVDGVRLAYSLWYPDEVVGKEQASKIGVEYQPNRIVHGGVVKANGAAKRMLTTYARSEGGLLIDKSALLAGNIHSTGDLLEVLAMAVQSAAEAGHPYTKTGTTGLFVRREGLPYDLCSLSRHRIEALAGQAIEKGIIVTCAARGEKSPRWLDVPGGMFAIGLGSFSAGAHRSTA